MNVAVVGCGAWGTVFARLLADREHAVTLVCRDPEQAAAIRGTGRNPRHSRSVDLTGLSGVAATEARLEDAELIVLAVPSTAFAGVAASLPGTAPVLSLTKGLDPATAPPRRRSSASPRAASTGSASATTPRPR